MIIMASASGTLVPAIARLVAADEDTVRDVIHLFNAKGLAALDPQWAGGRPRLISDDDVEVIVTAATTRPEKLGLPFTHWSLRKLAAYLAGQRTGLADRAGAAAADPARPRDQLPAHPDLEGVHRPGPGRQAGPDRVRDQHITRTAASPLTSSGRCRSGPATASAGRRANGPARLPRDLPPHPRHPLLPRLLLPGR